MFKHFTALFVVCIALLFNAIQANALVLNAGDTYIFEFDSMIFKGASTGGDSISTSLSFASEEVCSGGSISICTSQPSFGEGDSFQITWYEDTLTDTPFKTAADVGDSEPNSTQAFVYLDVFGIDSEWADLQGLLTIEAITGSFIIGEVDVVRDINGEQFKAVQAVPVPAAAWFFSTGMLCLLSSRWKS